jgi:hypothetical protein
MHLAAILVLPAVVLCVTSYSEGMTRTNFDMVKAQVDVALSSVTAHTRLSE